MEYDLNRKFAPNQNPWYKKVRFAFVFSTKLVKRWRKRLVKQSNISPWDNILATINWSDEVGANERMKTQHQSRILVVCEAVDAVL